MLEAQNLTKHYNGTCALDALNLKVEAGEVFCLLGANGAGKTTTIHLFLNFIKPSSGKAIINGLDVNRMPDEIRRLVAYLPEQVALYPRLSGLENLDYFSRLSGHRYNNKQLLAFLVESGLSEEASSRPVRSYSKGMRQKVGIAIALAKEVKVLLLDEPTSGLDPQASYEFSNLLQKLARSGVAVLMATHDLFRVKETGMRAGIMRSGKMVALLDTSELSSTELEQVYLTHMQAGLSVAGLQS
ncbi:MAG: ABC transporter ATP-binding protein [Methylococcaceae bacterium]|nr:ABC transporter ATP-binding protein [Methylococcaceae bacterium]